MVPVHRRQDLLIDGITIHDEYHGNTIITSALLENFGLYVHHGNNMNGALGAYTNSEATALEDWVYNGGRMLFMGYHSTQEACEASNSIPYQFGVYCALPYYSWNGTTSTFVPHPITQGSWHCWRSWRRRQGCQLPRRYWRLLALWVLIVVEHKMEKWC